MAPLVEDFYWYDCGDEAAKLHEQQLPAFLRLLRPGTLDRLNLSGPHLTPETMRLLLPHTQLTQLEIIQTSGGLPMPGTAAALAQTRSLARLQLWVLGAAWPAQLLPWIEQLTALSCLDLRGEQLPEATARGLLHLPRLRSLACAMADALPAALVADVVQLTGLTSLSLEGRDGGAAALPAEVQQLTRLSSLQRLTLTGTGCAALPAPADFPQLRNFNYMTGRGFTVSLGSQRVRLPHSSWLCTARTGPGAPLRLCTGPCMSHACPVPCLPRRCMACRLSSFTTRTIPQWASSCKTSKPLTWLRCWRHWRPAAPRPCATGLPPPPRRAPQRTAGQHQTAVGAARADGGAAGRARQASAGVASEPGAPAARAGAGGQRAAQPAAQPGAAPRPDQAGPLPQPPGVPPRRRLLGRLVPWAGAVPASSHLSHSPIAVLPTQHPAPAAPCCADLEELDLDQNPLQHVPAALAAATALRRLSFSSCSELQLGPRALSARSPLLRLTALKRLHLACTRAAPADVAQLRRRRPELEIIDS